MEAYERLRRLVDEVADDLQKAAGGNKAAGTRVRKSMQDVKATAQEIRVKILEMGKVPESPGSQPPTPPPQQRPPSPPPAPRPGFA